MEKVIKNVGLLTFHRAENYGAVLQAYALKGFMSKIGCSVTIIDFRCKSIEQNYQIFNPSIIWSRKNVFISLKTYFLRFLDIKNRIEKKRKFRAFLRSNFNMTKSMKTLSQEKCFDAIVVGSDQVWNLHLTRKQYASYFLDQVDDSMPRIAYAASSEISSLELIKERSASIGFYLNKFNAVSVREEFLKECLQKLVKQNINLCLDPTFLLNASDYQKLAIMPNYNNYILVYHVGDSSKCVDLAGQLAKKANMNIIEIFAGYSRHKNDGRYKSNLGVEELLGYFFNAGLIITTSFHGLAFALIFKKDFWIINKDNNERQRDLLNKLKLSERLLNNIDDMPEERGVDYKKVDTILEPLIQESKKFLKGSLHSV